MTALKDAIALAKRKKNSSIPSPYGDGGVGDVLRGLIEEALQPILSTLEKDVQKEFSTRIDTWLSQHKNDFKGAKGDPGKDAEVDFKALAIAASKHITVPTAAEIAKFVKLPKIDQGAIVSKVLDKIGFDEEALFERLREKMLSLFVEEEVTEKLVEGTEAPKKMSISDIQGLEKFLREIMRAKREGNGEMIHGGGMTLAAGAGQTLVRNENGTWTLTTPGGSSPQAADLSSQCTGSNFAFTIPAVTTVLSLIGSDAPNIYRPDVDFIVSGTTLTLQGVNAPSNGATLILNYV